MRRLRCAISTPVSLSKSTLPFTAIRPRSGLTSPAIMLSSVVLPDPERPKNAVTCPCASTCARRWNWPRRRSTSISIMAGYSTTGTANQDFRNDQSDEGKHDGKDTQAQCLQVPGRRLGIAINGKRQGARLARNVGDKSDGGAELPQAAREGKQHPGDDARQHQRQSNGEKNPTPGGAQRAGGGFEVAVDALQRKADRPHQQRKAHDRGGDRCAGPAERHHNAEMLLKQLA